MTENQKGAWSFGAIVIAVWLILGLWVWYGSNDKPTAGQFGDTFGMANSLFSALAVIFVVSGLREQRISNEKTTKANQEMAQLNHVSARLQSLTFMADFHADLMSTTQNSAVKERYRLVAQDCSKRAIALMASLGEVIEPTIITSDNNEAAGELYAIAEKVEKDFPLDFDDTHKPIQVLLSCREQLKELQRKYPLLANSNQFVGTVKHLMADPERIIQREVSVDRWRENKQYIFECKGAIADLKKLADELSGSKS